ncbi:uncharacterized protein JCM6883_004900 [Sporobolomyces salmoneus]|uniref:uncharacterized protein n=1 Tax=Sporobolomyces salmoneus TaxID=183962 RepID=UPI003170A3D8
MSGFNLPHPVNLVSDSFSTGALPPWVKLDIRSVFRGYSDSSNGTHASDALSSNISLALVIIGAYLTTINQLSYWLREKLLLSSSLISFAVGIIAGPIALNWISPWIWVDYDEDSLHNLTFQITRLVIGIQVMFAGIDLPAAYLRRQWRSLFMLLFPVMTVAWFISGGFILLFIPSLTFLEALCIAACVTPTDPILANAIVKGRYAEKHVPKGVRDIISAESGANDGLGYPFLFLAIYLMERPGSGSINASLQHWVVTTWIYQILLACAIGALIGWIARKTLKEAHRRQLIDHESFLAYGIGLTFLTLGIVGVLGSDDVLACFIAGNSLTWSDHYRIETEDETFQDVIDNLLNTTVFIYLGTLMPWSEFNTEYLVPWKLFLLAVCILAFRRLPFLLAIHRGIPALPDFKQSLFAGWFGPIGVSAVYYAILAIDTLPQDRVVLRQVIVPVVLLMAMCSTIVHGVTIPLTRAAPVAVYRTKSVMSSQPLSSFFGYFRAPVTRESANTTSPLKKGIAALTQRSTSTASTPSRGVSRRNSRDGDRTSPIVPPVEMEEIPKAESVGGDETAEAVAVSNEQEEESSKVARENIGAVDNPTGSKVEFDLPSRSE